MARSVPLLLLGVELMFSICLSAFSSAMFPSLSFPLSPSFSLSLFSSFMCCLLCQVGQSEPSETLQQVRVKEEKSSPSSPPCPSPPRILAGNSNLEVELVMLTECESDMNEADKQGEAG